MSILLSMLRINLLTFDIQELCGLNVEVRDWSVGTTDEFLSIMVCADSHIPGLKKEGIKKRCQI